MTILDLKLKFIDTLIKDYILSCLTYFTTRINLNTGCDCRVGYSNPANYTDF